MKIMFSINKDLEINKSLEKLIYLKSSYKQRQCDYLAFFAALF